MIIIIIAIKKNKLLFKPDVGIYGRQVFSTLG